MPKTCLCFRCPAKCCRYLALQFDPPRKPAEFEKVRWYLSHEGVFVFVEEGKWYLHLYTRCSNLRADNRCGIYDDRPRVCRVYSNEDCDFTGSDYEWEAAFYSVFEWEQYARRKIGGGLPAVPPADPAKCPAGRDHEIPIFIDTPQSASDLDDVRWYVMHDGVRVRVDADDRWTLLYRTRPTTATAHERCSNCHSAAAPAEPDAFPRLFDNAEALRSFGRDFLGVGQETAR